MRTIFYLIDLYEGRVVESYEGKDNTPPPQAVKKAEQMAVQGHTYTLAQGTLFFQKDS